MRRTVAAIVLALAIESDARAQMAAARPAPAEIAAQGAYSTSLVLALVMTQLAAAGRPPTQADIDEAARQYFTNGAAATGVPTAGPGLAYFQNGAAVTGVPTAGPGAAYFQNGAAVTAYSSARVGSPEAGASHPIVPADNLGGSDAEADGAATPPRGLGEPAPGASPVASSPAVGLPGGSSPPANTGTGLTCSPLEIEAAMAIASQFAAAATRPSTPAGAPAVPQAAAAPVAQASSPPSSAQPSSSPPVGSSPSVAVGPTPRPTAGSLVFSRIAFFLGGAAFGGLAVVLWSRRPGQPAGSGRRPGNGGGLARSR